MLERINPSILWASSYDSDSSYDSNKELDLGKLISVDDPGSDSDDSE